MKGIFLNAEWFPKSDYKLSSYEISTGKAISSNKVWRNPKLEYKEIPSPRPGAREVIIRVRACGICGSDIHYVEHDEQGYILYPGHTRLNIILGHEFSGVVEEVGSDVKDLEIGDFVCVEEMFWCGECLACRNGFPNQCERIEEIGVTQNGGMAPYVAVPAKLCWKINEFKNVMKNEEEIFELGALVEPTSVAYNAIFERGQGFRPGAYAVVFGAGPIGLLATALIRVGGASKIIVFEPNLERRNLSKELGADFTFDTNSLIKQGIRPSDIIMDITNGRGADIFLEAAGMPEIIYKDILDSMAINAHIVQTAMTPDYASLYLPILQAKAGQLFGSVGHSGNGTFENVIRLIASGRLDFVRKIISRKYLLEDGLEAFEVAKKRKEIKIMLKV